MDKNHGGDVTMSQEEFDALMILKERNADAVARDAKTINRNHDLMLTCDAQAKRLAECDLMIQNYERVASMQRALIDLLRADHPKVASLEDLSEFWRQWSVCTSNLVKAQPQARGAVAEVTPDLFKSWSMWARDAGRASRSFALSGTRADVDTRRPETQQELQYEALVRARQDNAVLHARLRQLEVEVEAYKAYKKAQGG
jgi:choline dehydrogenase-like flavoprotein